MDMHCKADRLLPRQVQVLMSFLGMQEGYIEQGYCPREPCARLPSTYINHYCANGGVVCPQFGGKAAEADKRALEVLQEAYGPDYKVCPSSEVMRHEFLKLVLQRLCGLSVLQRNLSVL